MEAWYAGIAMMPTDSEGRQLRNLQRLIVGFLCTYAVLGFSTFSLFTSDKDKSIPPFFHWFLFAYVPAEQHVEQFQVLITSVGGKKLSQPVVFDRAGTWVIDPRSNRARHLIWQIGKALDAGDSVEAETNRSLFENAYLRPQTTYEIQRVFYSPIPRLQTGALESTTTVGIYTTV